AEMSVVHGRVDGAVAAVGQDDGAGVAQESGGGDAPGGTVTAGGPAQGEDALSRRHEDALAHQEPFRAGEAHPPDSACITYTSASAATASDRWSRSATWVPSTKTSMCFRKAPWSSRT